MDLNLENALSILDANSVHLPFMQQALQQAREAVALGEVPVGAVVVLHGEVVSSAHNLVETLKDPTAHAETLAIREACKKLSNWRLSDCVIYSTLEPCILCAGAIKASRISALYYGANDLRMGAYGSLCDLSDRKFMEHLRLIHSGILQKESAQLLKDFFILKRTQF